MSEKKKVTDILLDNLLKTAIESDRMPWERPWEHINSFNYFTLHEYRGINRWLVPAGEYLTKKQINDYNEANGTNYKFKKGIKWYMVLYVNIREYQVKDEEIPDEILEKYRKISKAESEFLGFHEFWTYYYIVGKGVIKKKTTRGYHKVADRQWFVDENGEPLPSKIDTGEVVFSSQKPADIYENYMSREGIRLIQEDKNKAFYRHSSDVINLPDKAQFKSESHYYGTAFHEQAHSTGHPSRLNREGITGYNPFGSKGYAREELVAELCAALLCAESGIMEYESQHKKEFDNHTAYLQSWIKGLKDTKDDIVYICSDAEKAFQFILSATDHDIQNQGEDVEAVEQSEE